MNSSKNDEQYLDQKQKENLKKEQDRFDHKEIIRLEEEQDFAKEARLKRKRQRDEKPQQGSKLKEQKTSEKDRLQRHVHFQIDQENSDENIDEDELFALDLQEADEKFSIPLQKQNNQFFADSGIKLEPFSLKQDIRGGILTKDGVYKLARERDQERELREDHEDYEKEEDAWLRTVKPSNLNNLDDEVDSDDDKISEQQIDDSKQSIQDKVKSIDIEIKLLQMLLNFMQNLISLHFKDNSEKIQIVNIMNKLKKGDQTILNQNKFQNKKKNVRTKNINQNDIQTQDNEKQNQNQIDFTKLLNITIKLQQDFCDAHQENDNKNNEKQQYDDIFSWNLKQLSYHLEIKQKQIKNLKKNQSIWFYKIIQKDKQDQELQIHGPFQSKQMESWKQQGYFNEDQSQYCLFTNEKDYLIKDLIWLKIQDIKEF